MSAFFTEEDFDKDELRKQLNEIIFRGRSKPSVKELLDSMEEEAYCPIPTDEEGAGELIEGKDLEWQKVTLRVNDTADSTQTAVGLIIAKEQTGGEKDKASGNAKVCKIEKLPAVVMLHGTNASATTRRQLVFLTELARRGMVAVGMDARYHGSRRGRSGAIEAEAGGAYFDALVRAWRGGSGSEGSGGEQPFVYDTAADLQSVADYLESRADVSADHMGITGVSLGGMHAWFGAAADERWHAVAPLIGVQSFRFALDHNEFHGRVASLQPLFDAAAADLAKAAGCPVVVDAAVVANVWDRICPRLTDGLDAAALALLCPRHVFVASGADDPRCPASGVRLLEQQARRACWRRCGFDHRLVVKIYS